MAESIHVEFFERGHRYKVNGVYVPSVTTVLGMFDKPGIPYWVQTILTRNIAGLYRRRGKVKLDVNEFTPNPPDIVTGDDIFRDGETLLEVLKRLKLTFRDESGRAAERGLAIHTIFEEWGERQVLPSPKHYPQAVRPYLQALAQFLMTEQPEVEQSETLIGSAKHGFAGRCDTVVLFKRRNGKRVRADLKTSKRVYPETMFPQVEAYEGGDIEMRGEAAITDERAIIHLDPSGKYDPKRDYAVSTASFDDFLKYLEAFKARKRIVDSYKVATKHGRRPRRRR